MLFKNRPLGYTLMGLVVIISFVLGLFFYQHLPQNKINESIELNYGTYLTQPRTLKPFKLELSNGNSLSVSQLVGQWTILFFGYTQCHSICPTTMAMLHQTYDILRKDGVQKRPQMVMVSLDANRDSLETLKKYTTAFDKEFLGARTNQATLDAMTQELGVVYATQNNNGEIDHSGTITVISPLGEIVAFFTPPMHAKEIAQDLETLMSTFQIS